MICGVRARVELSHGKSRNRGGGGGRDMDRRRNRSRYPNIFEIFKIKKHNFFLTFITLKSYISFFYSLQKTNRLRPHLFIYFCYI